MTKESKVRGGSVDIGHASVVPGGGGRMLRRARMGANVVMSLVLAAMAVVLVNALAWRLPQTWDLDVRSRHHLSEKTLAMLRGLEARIEIIALFDAEDRLYDDVRALLREYQHAASSLGMLEIDLELVDPGRDIARTRQLARTYDLESGNQVIFRSGENFRIINVSELARYEIELSESGVARRMVGFLGEQSFSSAILSVVEETTPVVYFLTGHGERDIDDFSHQTGYSALARAISRDNFAVRRLHFSEHEGVPEDCRVLVIAGPDRRLAEDEVRWIEDYLRNRHGRLLLLLDPQVDSGLETLLQSWDVHAASGYVVGLTFSGRELVITSYGDHPVTRNFRNVTTMFYMPRPLIPLSPVGGNRMNGGAADEDRVRVSVLARTGQEGWVETDFTQSPPVFDEGVDRAGPVPVALAVERGALSIDAQLQPTRLVVIGDSFFVTNAALSSGVGGNLSFFMSALNWLAERHALLTVEPRIPHLLQPELGAAQWRQLFLILAFLVPGILAIFGGIVAYWRRQ